MTLPEEAAAFLHHSIGEGWSTQPLAGDASYRRYFRVAGGDGTTYVLAWYPQEMRSEMRRFLDAYRAVSPFAFVPKVIEYDEANALQQDVGDHTLFNLLHEDREEGVRWYKKAVTLLAYFQRAGGLDINPPFSGDFFAGELEMTREFYVEKLMGVDVAKSQELTPLFKKLAINVSRHPYVLCP